MAPPLVERCMRNMTDISAATESVGWRRERVRGGSSSVRAGWNHVSDPQDVLGAAASAHRYAGAAEFEELCAQHGLVDAWRHLHPGRRAATHFPAGARGARLDRWYVSAPILDGVSSANILHDFPGDHLAVDITISPPGFTIPSGPGRFRLPLHHLSDPVFCAATKVCIPCCSTPWSWSLTGPALPSPSGAGGWGSRQRARRTAWRGWRSGAPTSRLRGA